MTERLNLVGFYAEGSGTDDDPYRIVIVDANNDEHEATTPDELWRAMWAIRSDRSLPGATIDEPIDTVSHPARHDESIYDHITNGAASLIEARYGPHIAQAASKLIRNGAPTAHRFLKRISR